MVRVRMRALALVVVLVVIAGGCDWWQWGGNAEHRASNIAVGLTKTAAPAWVASKVVDLQPTGPVVTANGLAFVTATDRIVAFDPSTSGIAWDAVLPAGSTVGSAPAISGAGANSTLFVVVSTAARPVLFGYDVDGVRGCNAIIHRCSPIFTANLGDAPGEPAPALVDGSRVFARGANTLYAFDALGQTSCSGGSSNATCTPLWSTPAGSTANGVGPTALNGTVFDPEIASGNPVLRAYNQTNGALLWTGPLSAPASATPSVSGDNQVFVPAGDEIQAFPAGGCGNATCSSPFSLVAASGDPAGDFLSTPAYDGGTATATNGNGRISWWSTTDCGNPGCAPIRSATANAPLAGSSTYRQSPIIASGIVLVVAVRAIGGADHVVLVALDPANGADLKVWDFGAGSVGAGLANASTANEVVFAPVGQALFSVRAPAVRPLASLTVSPLALSPAFSPATSDYVVRCAAGTNSLTFTMTAEAGGTVQLTKPTTTAPSASQSPTVGLTPNQAAVIHATNAAGASSDYWVRCLPPDFPTLDVTKHPENGDPTPGWYLLGNNILPSGGTTNGYAMILDTNGTPVWYKQSTPPPVNVHATRPGFVAFEPVATIAGFTTDPNTTWDEYSLADGSVRHYKTVGMPADLHELTTLPNGHHLMLSYPLRGGIDLTGLNPTPPVTPAPGPNSNIADCVIQDIDPAGNLAWQWTGSDHMDAATESFTAPVVTINGQSAYDVFHCNSIDVKPNGDVLLSVRHTNAVMEIRRSDGHVTWKMGGKPVNKDNATIIQIADDPEGGHRLQHDARYIDDTHISMFDNHAVGATPTYPARGVEYAIDFSTSIARPTFSYTNPEGLASCCMGSFRRSPDGHRVIGWGYMVFNGRAMTELNNAGQSVLDVSLPTGNGVYRAIKVPSSFYEIAQLRARAGT
jgi:hypothetical protein